MPKRTGNIYQRMESTSFIRKCMKIGTRDSRKKRRHDVKRMLKDPENHVQKMAEIVRTRSHRPALPHGRRIFDPSSQKWRDTNSVPFWPDGLLQIMAVQAMMDVLMRGMCHWSCASIPGRGGKRVRARIRYAMRRGPKWSKYGSESDTKNYYGDIPLDELFTRFERKIKDKEFLLFLAIITTCEQITLAEAEEQGLTWRDITRGRVGLLIGFYCNQWSANFYFEELDRFIEHLDGVKVQTRHMDNRVLLGPNKRKLHRARQDIAEYMWVQMGLTMKSDWQIYRTSFTRKTLARRQHMTERQRRLHKPRMVAAVGYRFAHTYIILRKRNFLRLARQSRRIQKRLAAGKPIAPKQAQSFLCRVGQLKWCNSRTIRRKYVDPIDLSILKGVVKYESQRRQRAAGHIHCRAHA